MRAPTARGWLSARVLDRLVNGARVDVDRFARRAATCSDPLLNEDLNLALALCYELHYSGLEGADERLEWSPDVLTLRGLLETAFEAGLRELVPLPVAEKSAEAEAAGRPGVTAELVRLVEDDEAPALSPYMARRADLAEYRELLIQRSIYHLKEADPHTWAIPRLKGRAKSALVEIQADEYGGGRPGRMHSQLFAQSMGALGLDSTYGRYWDQATAQTLATNNLMSLFGLHRRHRGSLVGHLAVLEMTSTAPNRRYAIGLRRLGLGPEATAFFDEHVQADAVHEQVASVDLCGSLVSDEPALLPSLLWGARCCLRLDAAAGQVLLARWSESHDAEVA